MSPYGNYVLETILTLIAVSLLAFVLLYGARRAGSFRPMGGVDVVGRVAIDARRSVVLVRVGPHVFVVGVSEAGLTKLGELASSEVPAPPDPPSAVGFASILRGALGSKRDDGGAP